MPSINFQNLLTSMTTDYQIRRVNNIDPNNFTKTVLQISDQQSRDKYYEKGLEWLRTYVASLEAKLNSIVEELNGIYETMLTDGLYKRADSKNTAQLLNKLPNADVNTSCLSSLDYNPKDLEITPYDQNVKYYQYNPLFASRAVDMANEYNYSNNDNRDTSIARILYEADAGVAHRELGTSGLATLNYLWMWDVDRINATYATTKDSFIDEQGVLHVKEGDPRATTENLSKGTVVTDTTMNIAGQLSQTPPQTINNIRGVFSNSSDNGTPFYSLGYGVTAYVDPTNMIFTEPPLNLGEIITINGVAYTVVGKPTSVGTMFHPGLQGLTAPFSITNISELSAIPNITPVSGSLSSNNSLLKFLER